MTESLKKVALGLNLVYWGLMLQVLAVVLGILAGCGLGAAAVGGAAAAGGGGAGGAGAGAGAGPGAGAVAAIGGFMIVIIALAAMSIIGQLVGLVGRFFCLAVPSEAGNAKTMIFASLALNLLSLAISGVDILGTFGGVDLPREVKASSTVLQLVFAIAATICFLLFTKNLAIFVNQLKLAASSMSVLWLWVGAGFCYVSGAGIAILGVVGAGAVGGQGAQGAAIGGGCIGVVLIIAALVFALIALVRYATLLLSLRQATLRFAKDQFEFEGESAERRYDDDRRDSDDDGENSDKPWRDR